MSLYIIIWRRKDAPSPVQSNLSFDTWETICGFNVLRLNEAGLAAVFETADTTYLCLQLISLCDSKKIWFYGLSMHFTLSTILWGNIMIQWLYFERGRIVALLCPT